MDRPNMYRTLEEIKCFESKWILNKSCKPALLMEEPKVQHLMQKNGALCHFFQKLSQNQQGILSSIIFLEQALPFFNQFSGKKEEVEKLYCLIEKLEKVELFYENEGGLIGYHKKIVELILEKLQESSHCLRPIFFQRAVGLNLTQDSENKEKYQLEGLKNLPFLAELYPVGGAGDRLNLLSYDQTPLPAALLYFCGRTLLEGLIRDLQSREYLYYRLFGKQLITPVAMMTSYEKNNHAYLYNVCSESTWFGRGEENFYFFTQPQVPVVTASGKWRFNASFDLALKPGGHGMIWKLAEEQSVFDWFESKGRKKGLIRQINNPLAGLDANLLAFPGKGFESDKGFGFLSCERLIGSAEGVLVLTRDGDKEESCYKISNLEYTDFEKYGVKDQPYNESSIYSLYPSNTNILFFDIYKIRKLIAKDPLPGLIVNLKEEKVFDFDEQQEKNELCARLESTMQNISDNIATSCAPALVEKHLDSFIVYNERKKTISVTKRSYQKGKSHLETPEGAFYDLNRANLKLLQEKCHFRIEDDLSLEAYLSQASGALFMYHPALGPTYEIIAQKIRNGVMKKNAELQLEVAEVDIEYLELNGSLLIMATNPLGFEKEGLLQFSDLVGRVELSHVIVNNLGRSQEQSLPAWQNSFVREEMCKIILHGNAEFCAKNVELKSDLLIEVPSGVRATAYEVNGELKIDYTSIDSFSWRWSYQIEGNSFKLHKI